MLYTMMDYISQGSGVSASCFLIGFENNRSPRITASSDSSLKLKQMEAQIGGKYRSASYKSFHDN